MSSILEKHKSLIKIAGLLIIVPPIVAFFAGAGAGTILNGLAWLLGAIYSIFGLVSILLGFALLIYVGWLAYKDGDLDLSRFGIARK